MRYFLLNKRLSSVIVLFKDTKNTFRMNSSVFLYGNKKDILKVTQVVISFEINHIKNYHDEIRLDIEKVSFLIRLTMIPSD